MAYAGQTPSTDQALADQPLEDRADLLDKSRIKSHAASSVGPLCPVVLIGHHIRMEKEQIEPRQLHASKAPFDRLAQERFDFLGGWIAEIAFAGDPHAIRQAPTESFADDPLCPAVTVARRQVDQVDPGSHRGMHGRDALLECCLAPDHADTAAAQCQRRDRRQVTKAGLLHECRFSASVCFAVPIKAPRSMPSQEMNWVA